VPPANITSKVQLCIVNCHKLCIALIVRCHCRVHRQSLGKVLESLNDHEMAAECLLTSLELEATSPVQPFHVIPRVLS